MRSFYAVYFGGKTIHYNFRPEGYTQQPGTPFAPGQQGAPAAAAGFPSADQLPPQGADSTAHNQEANMTNVSRNVRMSQMGPMYMLHLT